MPVIHPEAFAFLSARRSHPAKAFVSGGATPDRAALELILVAALRVPDHGKLEPWRVVVLRGAALRHLGDLAATLARMARWPPRGGRSMILRGLRWR